MMRNALESPVAEMAGLAAADHRRRHFELSKATQAGQRGDHRRHVTGLIFAQVTGFRAWIGDQLLAVAVIQLLRHQKRLVGRPTPTLATGLLQGGEIEKTRRRLPLFFNRDAEWPLMAGCGLCDRLGAEALLDPHFGGRGMTHQEAAACDGRRGHDLKIVLGPEVADFQLAQADYGQRRRLDPADSNDTANPWREQSFRRGPGKGKVEDLVRLLARHRRLIKRTQFQVWFQPGKGLLQRLWILCREQSPPHAPAIAEMVKNFLTNQLP